MIRRRFLQLMSLGGAGALAPLANFAGERAKTAVFHVKGFSCPTCATGLDAMLGKQDGIVSSRSTYPEGLVTVSYLPEKITDERIAGFIADLGFSVEGHADSRGARLR